MILDCKIKLRGSAKQPEKHGDWYDLFTAEETILEAGDYTIIDLGMALEMPYKYEALVIPRSSTFKKYGVLMTNSLGLIDEDYKGDHDWWGFPVYATKDTTIPAGVRIAQFRFLYHQPTINFHLVEKFNNESRGGFGSTDK